MKVLLTGANGFLGKYIHEELFNKNFEIDTLGRAELNDIICDISKDLPKLKEYELVIHSAGKAHSIPSNKKEALDFFNINFNGTKNILEALPKAPKYFVFISTVSVYGLDEGINIKEDAQLKAKEPYGKSKIKAESYLKKWSQKENCRLTILRLPLIFGKNPPGNLGKMINAIKKGYFFNIGKGKAKKSGVLAKDIAFFIPKIIKKGGTYNLTDGYDPSFKELSEVIKNQYNTKKVISLPYIFIKSIALLGDVLETVFSKKMPISSRQFSKMTKSLTFCSNKAKQNGWNPNKILSSQNQWATKNN